RVLEIHEGGGQATLDGHLITRGDDGWWRYGTRQANGRVAATPARVSIDEAPAGTRVGQGPIEFRRNLKIYRQYEDQLNRYLQARNAGISREVIAADEQVTFRIPALLFQVNNQPFQEESTPEKFEALYSGVGTSPTGTTTEMYLEQSFGQMLIQLDVYGPYTQSISNTEANDCWYGTGGGPILGSSPEIVEDFTGFGGLGLGGYGAKGMAIEAVPQSDPDVDYSQYDQDGNGYVDFLMIIHSGPGAETTGDLCDVHSHYFSGLGPAFGAPPEPTPVSADGVLIGPVLTVPELDAAIGVVSHEIMHALGEPDYYGTSGTAGTGDWDLGAGGSYGGIPTQTNPLHFNPVMKVNFGWVQPQRIDATTLGASLAPRSMHPDMLQVPIRIEPAGSENAAQCDQAPISIVPNQNVNFFDEDGNCLAEGFLIENIHRSGALWDREACTFIPSDFDRQGYGTGLIVWHWDFENFEQLGNNNVLRPMLDIEEFDRRLGGQDLEQDVTRADPLDPFWGDPVGISDATLTPATGEGVPAPPEGSPYTMTAPAPGTTDTSEPWTVPADLATGVVMTVILEWDTQDQDDWDLYVEIQGADDEWAEAARSASNPATGAESVAFVPKPGATYRVRADNFVSVSQTATATVAYDPSGVPKFGPANTRNALFEPTGWQFTNLSPNDYRGMAHAAERAETPITLDLVKHDATTLDVSGDFLEAVSGDLFAEPIIAGQPVTLRGQVYNHGGKAVSGASFAVYDADPVSGASPIATFSRDLAPYSKDSIEVSYTPQAGLNELYVTAAAPDDLVAGNNVVRTELRANAAGAAAVLLIDNDRGWATEQSLQANLNALGVPYHVVDGVPSAGTMGRYDAVIVVTSTVSGAKGVWSTEAWDELVSYLDPAGDQSVPGGSVWVASNRIGVYAATADIQRGDRLAAYFGLTAVNNILDPMGQMTGTGDVIGGDRVIPIGYVDGRPYLDYFEPSDATLGTTSMLFTHDARPGSFLGSRTEADTFTTVSTPSLTIVKRAADQLQLTREVLQVLGIATGQPAAGVQVAFNRFQHVQVGEDWIVPIGATGVERVELRYRIYGTRQWKTLAGTQVAPGLYEVTIPGADVHNNGLEYYVQTVSGGVTTEVDGGAAIPDMASAPYGDPADVDYGVCAAALDAGPAPLPATGGGLALLGLLLAVGVSLPLRRRRGLIG
ncbi:MAG TPA: immune inhibitor A domain-containing protein, partial [Nitriliruptorales bacterium]